jgi:hypothetical protein
MITLDIPTDEAVLAAVGEISIRHGQLDHVLRMTIKSILNLPVRAALEATARQGSKELRERVRKLAKQKFGECEALVRLDALLDRSRRATDKRNALLHPLWARNNEGDFVIRDDDHHLGPAPTPVEIKAVANELAAIASDLNEARLLGFLKEALEQTRRGQHT